MANSELLHWLMPNYELLRLIADEELIFELN
jgi:hypothetical protein